MRESAIENPYPNQLGSSPRKILQSRSVAAIPNKIRAQNKQLTPKTVHHFPEIQVAIAYPKPTGTNEHRNERRNQ
jgi:hypothetical protein